VGGRVLVVDDEEDLRFLLRRFFEKAGYEVSEAVNGAAAERLVHESRPDLVVTDLMMPMMDGFELIRHLRADPVTAVIPIMAVSGNWEVESGADVVLAKPFQWQDVIAAAEDLLKDGRDAR
jgi:CheY-like chemotaxis protein